MARHAGAPDGGLWQRVRRVAALAGVVLAGVVLWCAAFTTAARHEHSPIRVMLHAP